MAVILDIETGTEREPFSRKCMVTNVPRNVFPAYKVNPLGPIDSSSYRKCKASIQNLNIPGTPGPSLLVLRRYIDFPITLLRHLRNNKPFLPNDITCDIFILMVYKIRGITTSYQSVNLFTFFHKIYLPAYIKNKKSATLDCLLKHQI